MILSSVCSIEVYIGDRKFWISENVRIRSRLRSAIEYFLGQVLDRPLVKANFTHFSILWAYGAQFSERYCMCVSLCTSVTVREHLACREQVVNIMGNKKYLDNFWTPKHFGHFWRHLWLALDFKFDRIWETSESYTTSTRHGHLNDKYQPQTFQATHRCNVASLHFIPPTYSRLNRSRSKIFDLLQKGADLQPPKPEIQHVEMRTLASSLVFATFGDHGSVRTDPRVVVGFLEDRWAL